MPGRLPNLKIRPLLGSPYLARLSGPSPRAKRSLGRFLTGRAGWEAG
jgi:hypothetical protein